MMHEVIEGFRLSSQQKRAWRRRGAARNAACAVLVEGPLEDEALREALRLLTERHEILRTTLRLLPGMTTPVQVIADSLTTPVRRIDEGAADPAGEAARVEQLLAAEREAEFDYERGPLLRVTAWRSAPGRHVLVLCLPSVCADRLTLRVLSNELSRCYEAAVGAGELGDAPMQYADYAEWQNELLSADDEGAEGGRAFWRREARPSSPAPALPFQAARAPHTRPVPASLSFTFEPELSRAVAAAARASNAPEEVLLFACWQALVWRLTDAPAVSTGKLFTGRVKELRDAAGPFARYLPLTTGIDGGSSFAALLARIAVATRSAEEWQEYFVAERAGEDTTGEQLPPHGFDYETASAERYEAAGVSFTPLAQTGCAEEFDLRLSCTRAGESLRAELSYDGATFRPVDVERLAAQFQTLLGDAVAHPEKAVERLELVNDSERRLLLFGLNETRADDPSSECVPQLFEARVRQSPEGVALEFEGGRLSYGELNRRANRLAHYLRGCGVGPEVPVGLCLERSPELVVAMLGVLKAGGAYVPLDPDYPAARRTYICEETGLRLLLTQGRFRHLWSDFDGALLCLDDDARPLAEGADADPPVNVSPDNLAYVVHTSGSTGRPKGVSATHRGAVNYLKYLAEEFPLGDRDVVLQIAAPTFDASVRDIFGTLNAGATLLLVSQAESREPSALLSRIGGRGVTALLSVVPTMLGALLDAAAGAAAGSLRSVRLILSSGEPLPASYCRRAREVFGEGVLVVNQYGPTECAMTSSFHPVAEPPDGGATIPAGRPIRNRSLYLLDRHLDPAPFGMAGEVYIGGPGLARGYLNRPDLTAQSFVPDPFGGEPGARLYRTGDLARHLPDGQLELLGRLDQQVKLRGLRIEPAEIEAALGEHPEVRTAAVVMREDEPGDQRLVAYVAPKAGAAVAAGALRRHLGERLPEYMVPSAFVMLEALPLTPNGKVDRRALPAPEQVRPESSQPYVAPRTPVEAELAAVWAQVLNVERAGIHDDFFELGGHSLLAIQLASRISESFHINLPMARLFEATTIAQVALLVTQAQAAEEDEEHLAQLLAELKGAGEDALI